MSYLTLVIGQHPGEYGVLHEVIVGTTRQSVQINQVLEVRDLSILKRELITCTELELRTKFQAGEGESGRKTVI